MLQAVTTNLGAFLTAERVGRRLAAVLAADVAGYSRLMGTDEEGTLGRLKAVRKAVVDPTFAKHCGRIVKTTGDGLLVEFASAVDAVRGAVEVQRAMAAQNAEVPENTRLEFRIGIHVGDIIIDDNDIFGDGVNIAARLEGIAERGGICISDDALRQVRGKVDVAFDDMGTRTLKNIAEPMHAWQIRLDQSVAPLKLEVPSSRLSIAVLPFSHIGIDNEQAYFADGLTASLTTDLSRISGALVIASSTTSTLKGSSASIREIGLDLHARYILKGSVQKGGSKLRINAQLIDAATGAQLWVDRFDGDETDLFALQDQMTSRIANSVGRKIAIVAAGEADAKTTNASAIDHLMRGLVLADKPQSLENLSQQENHFREALRLEPENPEIMARLGRSLCLQGWQFGSQLEPDVAAQRLIDGARLAEKALSIDPDHAFAHIPRGLACMAAGNFPEALRVFERAHLLDRNLVLVLNNLATINIRLGRPLETIDWGEQALELDPRGPQLAVVYTDLGTAHFFLGEDKAAHAAFSQARTLNPRLPRIYPGFAALLARTGDLSGAAAVVAELLRLAPHYKLSKSVDYPTPFSPIEYLRLFENVFLPAARLAGLPE